jgi:hypothetical protein
MLTSLSDWFDGPEAELLAASFRRFMGTSGCHSRRVERPLWIHSSVAACYELDELSLVKRSGPIDRH